MTSVSQSTAPFPPTPSSSDPNAPVPGRNSEQFPNTLDLGGLDTRLAEKHRSLHPSMASEASDLSDDSTYSLNTEYRGPLIPPTYDRNYRRRTVVLCFDGTGDQFDLDNSNVIQFFSVLKKGDRKRQLVYYQSGIGTYTIPQVATPLYSRLSKTLDLMFARNLDHHVMSGYHFLMENFKDGDKICIFGFSRGAYVARALAGMIHKVGLLPAGNNMQEPFAYKMFKNDTELGWKQSVAFKRTFSMDVDIDFVGVWDTVASVGLLPTTLPFTKSNTAIKVFRHALSLDEHRAKFKPSTYQKITAQEAQRGDFKPPPTRNSSPTVTRGRKVEKAKEVAVVKDTRSATTENQGDKKDGSNGEEVKTAVTKVKHSSKDERRSESGSRSRLLGSIKRQARGISENVKGVVERVSSERERSKSRDDEEKVELSPDSERDQLEQMYLDRSRPTDVLEVWFAGCHCDVGGGSVPNSTPNNLARIPLRWMIRECFLARTGIQFEAERLRELGLDPATLYPRVVKVPHPENFESLAPIEAPLPTVPPPSAVSPAVTQLPVNNRSVMESPPKQEPLRTENTAEGNDVQEAQDAVKVIKAEETTVENGSDQVQALDMTQERNRQNNISMDATLVDSDGESLEAPDVHVERASVIEEKMSVTSQEKEALRSMPHLEGSAPVHHEDTLKPHPGPTPLKQRKRLISTLEPEQDVFDARCDVYDQLKLAKWWWFLEFMPFREHVQQEDGTFKKKWSINRGRARVVHQAEPLHVHRSVKMRMEAKDLKYKPRLKFEKEPMWVD